MTHPRWRCSNAVRGGRAAARATAPALPICFFLRCGGAWGAGCVWGGGGVSQAGLECPARPCRPAETQQTGPSRHWSNMISGQPLWAPPTGPARSTNRVCVCVCVCACVCVQVCVCVCVCVCLVRLNGPRRRRLRRVGEGRRPQRQRPAPNIIIILIIL